MLNGLLTIVSPDVVLSCSTKKSYRKKHSKQKRYNDLNEWILSKLIEHKIADEKEIYKYRYGITSLSFMIPGAIVLLLVGIVFNEFAFSIGFLFIFALIRGYYPGGHLKTKLLCFIGSVSSFTLLLINKEYLLTHIHVHTQAYLFTVLILGIIMQLIKILTNNMNDKRCRKGLFVIMLVQILFILASVWNITFLQESIVLSMICNFMLFLVEEIRKAIKAKNERLLQNSKQL